MRNIYIILVSGILLFVYTNKSCFAKDKSDAKDLKKSIVQIYTTYQKPDYNTPWQMLAHQSSSGSGCVINGSRIITNAHVVSDNTFIQVRKAGEVDRYTAEVDYISHDCDLALLKVKDKSFFKNTQSVEMGELPNLRDKVSVYGFPIGGRKLAITEGVVSRIEIGTYAQSSRKLLTMQVDATMSAGNSGGPVFKDKSIVGIAFQGSYATDEAIPVSVIKHFFKDLQDGVYDGCPYLGISIQTLENPAMRKKLKVESGQTGIYIRDVEYNTTAWPHLKRGDILLKIDGIKIANDGTVPFSGDRVNFVRKRKIFGEYSGVG